MEKKDLEGKIDAAYVAHKGDPHNESISYGLNELQLLHKQLYKNWYFPAQVAMDYSAHDIKDVACDAREYAL